MDQIIVLDNNKAWVVCKTTRKQHKESVQVLSALNMKRETHRPNARLYVIVMNEVGYDGMVMTIPPKISELLETYVNMIF